jgi:hypothetical protein
MRSKRCAVEQSRSGGAAGSPGCGRVGELRAGKNRVDCQFCLMQLQVDCRIDDDGGLQWSAWKNVVSSHRGECWTTVVQRLGPAVWREVEVGHRQVMTVDGCFSWMRCDANASRCSAVQCSADRGQEEKGQEVRVQGVTVQCSTPNTTPKPAGASVDADRGLGLEIQIPRRLQRRLVWSQQT